MTPGAFELGLSGSETKLSACDCVLDATRMQVHSEVRLMGGGLRRDVIAAKRIWRLHWSYLPGSKAHTFDDGMGRDELDDLFRATIGDADKALSLHLPGDADNAAEDVTVQFEAGSWRETLVMRDGYLGNVYDLALALVEV